MRDAAVRGHDIADNGQAQAGSGGGAGRVGAIEAAEDGVGIGGGDTRTVVPHSEIGRVHGDLDRVARRAELESVVEQVVDAAGQGARERPGRAATG
nr:hypothetical protein [Nocardia sp. CC227C]